MEVPFSRLSLVQVEDGERRETFREGIQQVNKRMSPMFSTAVSVEMRPMGVRYRPCKERITAAIVFSRVGPAPAHAALSALDHQLDLCLRFILILLLVSKTYKYHAHRPPLLTTRNTTAS